MPAPPIFSIPTSRRRCAASRRATASPSTASCARPPSTASTCRPMCGSTQLKINVARLKAATAHLPSRYVMVNIPAAQVEAVQDGVVESRHIAIVGRPSRPSPDVNSKITEINFNPYWTVPVSIVRRDLIPLMQKDPEVPRQRAHPHLRPAPQRADGLADRLEFERRGQLHVQAGPGQLQFARHAAHPVPQPRRRLYARHAGEEPVRRRHALRLLRLRAGAERAPAGGLAAQGHARLVGAADQRRHHARASASTPSSRSRCRCSGSISPPGRRPTAWCSSATTSTTRTASASTRRRRRRAELPPVIPGHRAGARRAERGGPGIQGDT